MSDNRLKVWCFIFAFSLGLTGLGKLSLATKSNDPPHSGSESRPCANDRTGTNESPVATPPARELMLGISIKDFPLFLAPLIVLSTSMSVFFFYLCRLEADWKKLVTGVALVLTLIICVFLTQFHAWEHHLGLMFGLFTGYVFWDWLMLCGKLPEKSKEEITTGNVLVNLPTLGAIGTVYIYLRSFRCDLDESTPTDMVKGLITFHLTAAAVL